MLQSIISELKEQGIAKEGKEGATLIFYPNDELSPLMIAKKDGSTLYATRDLATDKWRKENPRYQNADGSAPLVINEVGSEQGLYFKQLYEIEKILGFGLPKSAFKYNPWWANQNGHHPQARAWCDAGWEASELDLVRKRVKFTKTI